MFLSAVWTLILTAPIHCRGSIGEQVMQCYITPNLMKKETKKISFLSVFWITSNSNQKYRLDVVSEVFNRSGSP